MTGLARYVLSIMSSPFQSAAEQWFERTLDDSSNKRLTTPESFLATDGILRLVVNVARGMVVYPSVIASRVEAELPFMATEEILMAATAGGKDEKGKARTGDRQVLHEKIREHSHEAAREVKEHGRPNDLIERLKKDPAFAEVDFEKTLDAKSFVGLAPQQVDSFLENVSRPIIERYKSVLNKSVTLNV
jgi:adenylosuccinate lyase